VATLLRPDVEPSDGAVFPTRQEGVGVAVQGDELVGRARVAREGTAVRLLRTLQVWKRGEVGRAQRPVFTI
jgi:hypothetical protein